MLYKPEKYKVLEGENSNLALCTCWLDPFNLKKDQDLLRSKFAITGSLYSKEGVSIILRNLALNPSIRYLFVWSNTPLSNTPFGKAGRELLLKTFSGNSDLSEIHPEIDPNILEKITKNVEIIDLVDDSLDKILNANYGYYKNTENYMEAVEFPEPTRDESKPFPSEKVGWLTKSPKVYYAWLDAIDRIMRYGHVKQTEYGNNMRELHQINWVITKEELENFFIPDLNEKVKEIIGLSDESLAKYKESLLDPIIPTGTSYTYGSRLRSLNNEIDQVEYFIHKLIECQVSRRIVGTTLIPLQDTKSSSPPCLTQIQLLTDEGNNLNIFASFRSHDMFKAALPNAYGLLNLLKYICDKTKLNLGVLSISSISAHIYEEDWDNAKKLLDCQKWNNTNFRFQENTQKDHRGNVSIYLSDDMINLELADDLGNILYKDKNKFGIDIIMKMSKLDLLERHDHVANITYELTKADICLQNNIEYTQDRPLKLQNLTLIAG